MSISVSEVTKYYGSQAALKNVSFELRPGEIVGFLGPNGAGKSTMMKIITCFIPPTEGKVEVAGMEIEEKSLAIRKRVGYLPENNPLYPEMYIREYLTHVAGMYGVKGAKARVEEMIDLVGLSRESHKKIGELSKGYRQRVGLAQALIHDPEILILDEPTSGLDPNQLEDIRKLIVKIGKKKTVLLSTHIMQEVEAMCNRVIIIRLGEIVADSKLADLKGGSETEMVYLHVNKEIRASDLKKIEGVEKVWEDGPGKYRIQTRKSGQMVQKLNAAVLEMGAEVEELRRQEKSLEEVFKSLTR